MVRRPCMKTLISWHPNPWPQNRNLWVVTGTKVVYKGPAPTSDFRVVGYSVYNFESYVMANIPSGDARVELEPRRLSEF